MEKDPPPPYSSTGPTPAGFAVPPNQQPPQGYPPAQGGYPPDHHQYPPGQPPYPQGQPQYPQGQHGYPPGPYPQAQYVQPGGTTVVVTTVPVIAQYGPNPQPTMCPHCHSQITSRVESEAGMKTHLLAFILCLFGCVPCCLLPYCMDSCQSQNHYCPSCGAFLGTYDADRMYRRNY